MSAHDDFVYLCHMRDACSKVREYVDGFTWESFAIDGRTQDAVIRQLEVLGEASNRVSERYRDLHPVIPWREVKAFRNVMAHQYDHVVPDVVWKVAQKDIPEIMNQIEMLINCYGKEDRQNGMIEATKDPEQQKQPEQQPRYYEPPDRSSDRSDDRDDR